MPGTAEGTRLLAHQLTHVVQQPQGVSLQGGIGQVGDMYERHADAVADRVVAGRCAEALLDHGPGGASNAVGAAIQRQEPAPAPAPAPVDEQAAAPVETEGDKLKIFNQEFSLNAQIEAFQKAVMAFNKPIADVEKRQEYFEEKKGELEEQKTGEKAHDKGIDQAIKGQDVAIRQLDSAIATMEREQKKFATKVEKLKVDYAVFDAQDDALVRATAPLAGHPKPGEYILLGAGAAQACGVSAATKVTLAEGSFKHIAVFRSSEPAPSPSSRPDEKWEKWHTIDGGGTAAKTTELNVCLSDLRVQFGNPNQPWASSTTARIGWIDMDKLLAGSGGANKDGAAPPAP